MIGRLVAPENSFYVWLFCKVRTIVFFWAHCFGQLNNSFGARCFGQLNNHSDNDR